ncbi:MAG: hypothetical protein ACTHJW_28910 [Streptosporangiaceae bacterium]
MLGRPARNGDGPAKGGPVTATATPPGAAAAGPGAAHPGHSAGDSGMARPVRRLASRLRPHAWPAVTGLVLGLLALGPALATGFVLSYDMVFVPDPPVGYADLGYGSGPPRAVPSDLVVALAAKIIPAGVVQKLILVAIFVLACTGAAALLSAGWRACSAAGSWRSAEHDRQGPWTDPAFSGGSRDPSDRAGGRSRTIPLPATLAAGICYAWNPFVAERLIMGQWAMLLGYAGLPWVLREFARAEGPIRIWRLAAVMVPAAVGRFAAMSVTAIAIVPVALCAGAGWAARTRRLAVAAGAIAVASLPWLIPSLINPVHANPAGVAAFAARADTPFGTIGSLLMLGGIWNAQAVPAGYGGLVSAFWLAVVAVAIAGYAASVRPRRICQGAGIASVIGFCVAGLGLTAATRAGLRDAIALWPGFALLRDGQQFIAPLALTLALGLGAGVGGLIIAAKAPGTSRLIKAGESARGPAITLGVLALIAPVLLLPGLAWGAAGRLQAVQYPADWLKARQLIDADRSAGAVLLLPWAQYRRYPWNRDEAVFDPWPRFIDRPMIWNDALRVGRTTVPAESERARQLAPAISSGRPRTATLIAAGVRYVVVDSGSLLRYDHQRRDRLAALARLPGAQVMLASPDLVLFRLPDRRYGRTR